MPRITKHILWVDCIGAIATGVLLIGLSGRISPLYRLPQWFVITHACVHLAYGSFSLSLTLRKQRPMALIKLLVFANAGWTVFCLIFATLLIGMASGFAVAHFSIEGLYVGSLALVEWHRREDLRTAN